MVAEAPLVETEAGLAPASEGWFILTRAMPSGFGTAARRAPSSKANTSSSRSGIFLRVLLPGVPMGMYHRETDQEAFLVLSGEALLVVEGEERPLRRWHLSDRPPVRRQGARHRRWRETGPVSSWLVGSREHQWGEHWGAYTVDETALRHDAGVREEDGPSDPAKAYVGSPEGRADPVSGGVAPG